MRILIVEDIKTAQNMAMRAVKPFCDEVDIANSGAEALDQCSQHHYDLIFMDLGLPDMDGLTVTETIRVYEENRHMHTKIVALTAYDSEDLKKDAFEAGIDEFLCKPLVANRVKEIIDACV